MFHEGSLQSGIALAIQEQKLVACFVRGKSGFAFAIRNVEIANTVCWLDDGATSKTWEDEWLQSGWVC